MSKILKISIWIVVFIGILGLVSLVRGGLKSSGIPSDWKTYKNKEYSFRISYPETAQFITDRAQMAGIQYLPSCNTETGVACIYLPPTTFPNTNFNGANVSVNIVSDKTSDATCTAMSANEIGQGESQNIGGATFSAFATGDGAMSHQSTGVNYRTFYNNTCYEIETLINTTSFEVYEAGTKERFTDEKRNEVLKTLATIIHSFSLE